MKEQRFMWREESKGEYGCVENDESRLTGGRYGPKELERGSW